jgi:hypothetical protein
MTRPSFQRSRQLPWESRFGSRKEHGLADEDEGVILITGIRIRPMGEPPG